MEVESAAEVTSSTKRFSLWETGDIHVAKSSVSSISRVPQSTNLSLSCPNSSALTVSPVSKSGAAEKIDKDLKLEVEERNLESVADDKPWSMAQKTTRGELTSREGRLEKLMEAGSGNKTLVHERLKSENKSSPNTLESKSDCFRGRPMSEPDSVSSDVLGLKIERISQSLKRKFQTSQGKNCVQNVGQPVSPEKDSLPGDHNSGNQEMPVPLDLRNKGHLQNSPRPSEYSNNLKNSFSLSGAEELSLASANLNSESAKFAAASSDMQDVCDERLAGRSHSLQGQKILPGNSLCNLNVYDERFVQAGNVNISDQSETKEEMYECRICSKTFTHEVFLDMHNKMHHVRDGSNKIEDSSSHSAGTSRATRRRKRHAGDRPYHCDVCGKCFARSTHLVQHKRVHSGEKPYSCDVCGKCFARGVHLSDHKRLHSGERPYICGYCGKDFAQRSHLTQHMRIHTGEKPYKCDGCDKSFTDSSTLNRHKKKHIGENLS